MSQQQVIPIVQQKGGVGKSTVALGLAEALVHAGKRVGVIDLDRQGTVSDVTGARDLNQLSMSHILTNDEEVAGKYAVSDVFRPTSWGFDVAQSSPGLGGGLAGGAGDLLRLRRALVEVKGYDYILVDCPGSLGLVTQSAMTAATNGVLLVVVPERAVLDAMNELLQTIGDVQEALNPALFVRGVIVNRLKPRTTAHQTQIQFLEEHFRETLWKPSIADRIVIAASQAAGTPLRQWYDSKARHIYMSFSMLAGNVEDGCR